MILYFSGSGNSKYVAEYLADQLKDDIMNLGDVLKENKALSANSVTPYVIVSPVYISVIPLIIEKMLKTATLTGSKQIYFIMTCAGSGISVSAVCAKRICKKQNLECMGVTHLSMPQNYLMYFKIGTPEENKIKFDKAITNLPSILESIRNKEKINTVKPSLSHKLMASRPMIKLFDKMLIGSKKFKVNNDCISCGICEKLCPKNVIKLSNGKPVWNKKGCLHCTACINSCPKQAINYGKKTAAKQRYHAKRYMKQDI